MSNVGFTCAGAVNQSLYHSPKRKPSEASRQRQVEDVLLGAAAHRRCQRSIFSTRILYPTHAANAAMRFARPTPGSAAPPQNHQLPGQDRLNNQRLLSPKCRSGGVGCNLPCPAGHSPTGEHTRTVQDILPRSAGTFSGPFVGRVGARP
jgi:hypothetical protein